MKKTGKFFVIFTLIVTVLSFVACKSEPSEPSNFSVNGQQYESLQDAITSCGSTKSTVKLEKDVEVTVATVGKGQDVTLDLNGHSLKIVQAKAAAGIVYEEGSKGAIGGGTIKSEVDGAAVTINGDVELEKVEFKADEGKQAIEIGNKGTLKANDEATIQSVLAVSSEETKKTIVKTTVGQEFVDRDGLWYYEIPRQAGGTNYYAIDLDPTNYEISFFAKNGNNYVGFKNKPIAPNDKIVDDTIKNAKFAFYGNEYESGQVVSYQYYCTNVEGNTLTVRVFSNTTKKYVREITLNLKDKSAHPSFSTSATSQFTGFTAKSATVVKGQNTYTFLRHEK